METSSPGRRRAKISITVDPALLNAVDLYVQSRADLDRSKVMEEALQHWYGARQSDAMVDQFSGAEAVESSEQRSWRRIRRAAVSRKLKRPAR
jgi:metal-responsive CopG/Arc/MetJ family transcriptional regulator